MLEVTDMALCVRDLVVPGGPAIDLIPAESDEHDRLLRLVESEHPPFLPHYRAPSSGATAYAIKTADGIVGGILLQRPVHTIPESTQDAAVAALFIARQQRNRGLGSAAIAAASQTLANEGFERVVAEWVWSVQMYERLGYTFWRTRRIEQ